MPTINIPAGTEFTFTNGSTVYSTIEQGTIGSFMISSDYVFGIDYASGADLIALDLKKRIEIPIDIPWVSAKFNRRIKEASNMGQRVEFKLVKVWG